MWTIGMLLPWAGLFSPLALLVGALVAMRLRDARSVVVHERRLDR